MPADFPIKEYVSNSPDETTALGKHISRFLTSGSVVALQGTLGSGKTYLTKGIAEGLGITENLTSPTYTIINEYPYQTTESFESIFYHIDVYRLDGDKDFEDIGGIDILNSKGREAKTVCVIEWSERIQKSLPHDTITISIEITGNLSRIIRIKGLNNGN